MTAEFPAELTGEEQVLLLPAPLPASWIQAVLLASKEETLAHRSAETGIELGPAPQRIEPLRGLLMPTDSRWSKRQQEAALRLARGLAESAVPEKLERDLRVHLNDRDAV